jgi:hypothetical protein
MTLSLKYGYYSLILIATLSGCTSKPGDNVTIIDRIPAIDPDYTSTTIPYNIAPLNFKILEEGKSFFVQFSINDKTFIQTGSKDGIIKIPERKWKKMLYDNKGRQFNIKVFIKDDGSWSEFETIDNSIAADPVDPYITYRLLYPGYESWKEIFIKQRSLESFRERSIIENSLVEENCLNCHSYNNMEDSKEFLFHMRGTMGGTYFLNGGDFKKFNLKTNEMKNGAVYPRWHPSGRFVAFSSNKIIQQFHAVLNKKVEVSDLESSLVLYDVENNEMMDIDLPGRDHYLDTYPEWSPDGKYLYFCRAPQVGEVFVYDSVRYDLYRVPFDPVTCKTGEAELVFNASRMGRSVSFPRISPDGYNIVITLHEYGCFPIWHKEADLYEINLQSFEASPMQLNSDFTDSYHSWSSNSRWLVFSSKRIDGLTARFFISYIDKNGKAEKPFLMPQKDPEFYQRFLKSFNLPEFSTFEVKVNPGKIRKRAAGEPIQAKWAERQQL